jgi:site-specific DNA-methyltransferase (adenine-specific)
MDLRLLHGDCLEILPTLIDKSVDAIITDLPYGTTACSWDVVIPFAPMWEQVKRLCKGAFVTTASQPFTSVLIMSNLKWFRYEWVWEKDKATGHLDAKRRPMRKHENAVVFSANGHTYNPQITKKPPENIRPISRRAASDNYRKYNETAPRGIPLDMSYPQSVLKVNTTNHGERGLHPTQKPVALYEYLIKTYTNPGDTVLDFCMGSGTTGVACAKTGRNFIGIEKERNYFDIAERRIDEAQMQTVMEFA